MELLTNPTYMVSANTRAWFDEVLLLITYLLYLEPSSCLFSHLAHRRHLYTYSLETTKLHSALKPACHDGFSPHYQVHNVGYKTHCICTKFNQIDLTS